MEKLEYAYMTYRDLLRELKNFSDEQLDMTVTIHDASEGEYYPVVDMNIVEVSSDAPLDFDHPFLTIKNDAA